MYLYQFVFIFATVCELSAIPIVFKESTPNGEAVLAFSSSDPQLEKLFLDYATRRGARERTSFDVSSDTSDVTDGNKFDRPREVVHSFSVATPQRTIAGSGRSFGDQQLLLPLFINPNAQGFELNNWFRNIEQFYDPSLMGGGASAVTAVGDNGHVYTSAQSSSSINRRQA